MARPTLTSNPRITGKNVCQAVKMQINSKRIRHIYLVFALYINIHISINSGEGHDTDVVQQVVEEHGGRLHKTGKEF